MEIDYGYVLVYGVNEDLVYVFDFVWFDTVLFDVIEVVNCCGALVVLCYLGCWNVGLFFYYE